MALAAEGLPEVMPLAGAAPFTLELPAGYAGGEPKPASAPETVRPALVVVVRPVPAEASLSAAVTDPVVEEEPVAEAGDLGDTDAWVAGATELTLTEDEGESTALTVVECVREGDPEVDEPLEEVRGSVADSEVDGSRELELGSDVETEVDSEEVAETDAEIGCEDVGSESGWGTCSETERASAPPAAAPATASAPTPSATASLLPTPIIRDTSDIRP